MLVKVYIRRAKSHILVYIRRADTHILQNMTVCPRANSHILIILLVFAFQNLSKSHFWTNYARIFSHNCIGKKSGRGITAVTLFTKGNMWTIVLLPGPTDSSL